MKDEIDQMIRIAELISRSRKNELTRMEQEELDQWLSTDANNRDVLANVIDRQFMDQIVNSIDSFDEHAALRRLQRKTQKPIVKRLIRYISAAAAVLILTFGYFNRDILLNRIYPVTYKELATINGQRQTITLADGTKIWLSPASKLNYPDRFGQTREVRLEGEAFFEVAKDAAHPFVIQADHIKTTVLGTSFMIQARKDQQELAVTVVSGIVEVSTHHIHPDSVRREKLHRNQRVTINKQNGKLLKEDYPNAEQMLSLRGGVYNYQGSSIIEIIHDMQREHNITILLAGNLGNCTFYGIKSPQDNIEEFLRSVCLTINASLERNGNNYIITGKGC